MSLALRSVVYLGALLLLTALIWGWTRGAQRRRFRRAFPHPDPTWEAEDGPFLALLERTYRLPKGAARHLPKTLAPINLYLTLYPEHCIYDERENERFVDFLRERIPRQTLPKDPLTHPLAELAALWRQSAEAPSSTSQS